MLNANQIDPFAAMMTEEADNVEADQNQLLKYLERMIRVAKLNSVDCDRCFKKICCLITCDI